MAQIGDALFSDRAGNERAKRQLKRLLLLLRPDGL